MGPHEPYWRTNSSYSPPPSRWDFRFQPEALSFGSHDGIQLLGSTASSNSRESRSWLRDNNVVSHQYMANDGAGPYYSSPSDLSPVQQWTPPTIQEVSVDNNNNTPRRVSRSLSFSPVMEATSAARDSECSTSSRSDSSDYSTLTKAHHSHHNFSSRRCLMSKPVHPLSLPSDTPRREASDNIAAGFSEFDAVTPRRENLQLSSASGSADLTDVSEPLEADFSSRYCNPSESFRCALCERLLSQKSPWSSRRIVRSGDMPVAGVLSCSHVFHADCLEQTTPKANKSNPPCPICAKVEEDNSPDQQVFSKFFPRLRPFREDGASRPWVCAQAGDCVEGALHARPSSSMLSLARRQIKKNLSLKGNLGKEFPGKVKKSHHGVAGSSKTVGSTS